MSDKYAVLLIDMQEYFLRKPSKLVIASSMDREPVTLRDVLVENQAALIRQCNDYGIPVCRVEWEDSGETISPLKELIEANPQHLYSSKNNWDAFFDSPLERRLKKRGVNHIVVSGFNADVCVISTMMGGVFLDFNVSTAKDLIANTRGFGCSEEFEPSYRKLTENYFETCWELMESLKC